VPGAEGVVLTLRTLEEAGQSPFLAQGLHALVAAGEELVRIRLVAHVPHQLVVRRIEDRVQGDGEFHHAEPGADVPAGARAHVDEPVAEILREDAQFIAREATDVSR